MPSVLSKSKAMVNTITRVLPYTILVRLCYTLLKTFLRRFKIPYSSLLSQVLTVWWVRRSHKGYFIILFMLEYFFKNYIYKIPANRDDKMIKGGLCMGSMGLFAVAMSEGKQRAIGPLNAISGYDINKLSKYLQGGPFFRPEGISVWKWHLNLYVQTAKNSIVPLTMAVFVPTFISYCLVGKSVEKIIYESKREGLLSSNNQSSVDLASLVKKGEVTSERKNFLENAFEKAVIKTARYGSYLVIGLSNYPQIVELYVWWFKKIPSRKSIFLIGMWGGVSWFLIPGDKIHAYNHWSLTTMTDAMLHAA